MKLEIAMSQVKKSVDGQLADFFRAERKEAGGIDEWTVEIVDQIKDLTLRGGKRTRAFLVWLGSKITGKSTREVVPLMMAVELFQSSVLIHDDIIDKDAVRRGGPTIHAHFAQKLDKGSEGLHFGESLAILAGDLALAWAEKLAQKTQNTKVVNLFNKMAGETFFGQILDVRRNLANEPIEKPKIDLLKTALYSAARPLELGATFARAGSETLAAIRKYGLAAGSAYQLRDDFLDGDISERDFFNGKKEYLNKIGPLVKQIKASPQIKSLFDEFALFVVTRPK